MRSEEIQRRLAVAQGKEITEHYIYQKLARSVAEPQNRDVFRRIAADELRHYNLWKQHTRQDVRPNMFKVWVYYLVARILGMTFGIKLMEKGEGDAIKAYRQVAEMMPVAEELAGDEKEHEKELIGMIAEDRLRYIGDIVRGLNVALMELTGVVAGLTLALHEARLILAAGIITGITMTLSVGATEYLATRSSGGVRSPFKAVFYAGLTNLLTVIILLFPYLIFGNIYVAMVFMIIDAVIIIMAFAYYLSVIQDISMKSRFTEMALISLGVAALAFVIGLLVRDYLHIDTLH